MKPTRRRTDPPGALFPADATSPPTLKRGLIRAAGAVLIVVGIGATVYGLAGVFPNFHPDLGIRRTFGFEPETRVIVTIGATLLAVGWFAYRWKD